MQDCVSQPSCLDALAHAACVTNFQNCNATLHACETTPPPPPPCIICDKGAGIKNTITSLTFEYLGPQASHGTNDQGTKGGKWDSNFPLVGTTSSLGEIGLSFADKDGNVVGSPVNVDVGDTFVVATSNFPHPELQIQADVFTIILHTSCSVPLKTSDIFGPFKLIDFGSPTTSTCPIVPCPTCFECPPQCPPPAPPPCVDLPYFPSLGDVKTSKVDVCNDNALPGATSNHLFDWVAAAGPEHCKIAGGENQGMPGTWKATFRSEDYFSSDIPAPLLPTLEEALCNQDVTAPDECPCIEISYQCCDPCVDGTPAFVGADDGCVSMTSTFCVADAIPPILTLRSKTVECNINGLEPTVFAASQKLALEDWATNDPFCIDNQQLSSDTSGVLEVLPLDGIDFNVLVPFEPFAPERLLTQEEFCTQTTVIRFGCTDDCGNLASLRRYYQVRDSTPPVLFSVPSQPSPLECSSQDGSAEALAVRAFANARDEADFEDNCVQDIDISFISSPEEPHIHLTGSHGNCRRAVDITWCVEDRCGLRSAEMMSTFEIVDTTPPEVTCSKEICDLEVPCNEDIRSRLNAWLDNNAGFTATDRCSDVNWTYFPRPIKIDNTCDFSVTVTFTATDTCGNQASKTATFMSEDKTAPVFTVPPSDYEVECDPETNLAQFLAWVDSHGNAEAADNCHADPPPCPDYSYSRNLDKSACNYCSSTYAPVCYDGTTYTNMCEAYCAGALEHGTATEGICPKPPPPPPPLPEACGYCFGDMPVCGGGVNYANPCMAYCQNVMEINSGYCEEDQSTVSTLPVPGSSCYYCGIDGPVVCGADGNQYDNKCHAHCAGVHDYYRGPCLAPGSECGESNLLWSTDYDVTVLGALGHGLKVTTSECNIEVPVEFKVEDPCGNQMSGTSVFRVIDRTPPVITEAPKDVQAECSFPDTDGDVLASFIETFGGVKAEDSCGGPVDITTINSVTPGPNRCVETSSFHYIATDECGNNVAADWASVTFVDTAPPRILVPPKEIEVECAHPDTVQDIAAWLENYGGAEAVDDCWKSGSTETLTHIDGVPKVIWRASTIQPFLSTCYAKQEVHFTATDPCDNSVSASTKITMRDTIAPKLDVTDVSDKTVECGCPCILHERANWIKDHAGASADDSCSLIKWSETMGNMTQNMCIKSTPYTFSVTDVCGNQGASVEAIFNIKDTLSPNIENEAQNETIECTLHAEAEWKYNHWLERYAGTIASDQCDKNDLQWSVESKGLQSPSYVRGDFARCRDKEAHATFTATDMCGHEVSSTAKFLIVDTIPPTINTGAGVDLLHYCDDRCDDNAEQNAIAAAVFRKWARDFDGCLTANDCNDVMWSWSGGGLGNVDFDVNNLCGKSGKIRFMVTDVCPNNVSSYTDLEFSFPWIPKPAPVITTPRPITTSPPCPICTDSSGGKDSIVELTFQWSGSNTASFRSDISDSASSIAPGGVVTVTATSDAGKSMGGSSSSFKMPSNLAISVAGEEYIGAKGTGLHTSCSIPLMLGQTLQFSTGSLEIIGFKTNSGRTEDSCPSNPPWPTPSPPPPPFRPATCDIPSANQVEARDVCVAPPKPRPPPPPPPPPCIPVVVDACKAGKVSQLNFEYVGGNELTNMQDGKASVTGTAPVAGADIQCMTKGSLTLSQTDVDIGDALTLGAGSSKLGSETTCTIGQQTVEIHTSCSHPINVGDIYGALKVTGFRNEGGINSITDGCTAPAPFSGCDACFFGGEKSKATAISFRYIGGFALTNTQEGKATLTGDYMEGAASISCSGAAFANVALDGTFTLSQGSGKQDQLPAETICTINSQGGRQTVKIHTSCSKTLAIGDIFGSIVVTGFTNNDGRIGSESELCLADTAFKQAAIRSVGAIASADDANGVNISPMTPVVADGCDSNACAAGAKVASVTFRFDPSNSFFAHHQANYNLRIEGHFVDTAASATRIKVAGFAGGETMLEPGRLITIDAVASGQSSLPNVLNFYIGEAATRIRLRSGCASELHIGDRFGVIELVGYSLDTGVVCGDVTRTQWSRRSVDEMDDVAV